MTRALFVTTKSNDVDNVISAWDFWNPPSDRVSFDHMNGVDDAAIIGAAKHIGPAVIFYIGSVGPCSPTHDALRRLRDIAPSIHICFDAADEPWHPLLAEYSAAGCFDLQVSIDGVRGTPVDLVTVAPVNPAFFDGPGPDRTIRCGFSGNIGLQGDVPTDQRGTILGPLIASGLVERRQRDVTESDSYTDHVEFMRKCRIIINTSFAGSGTVHHVKQRVFESAFAGCALLENDASPVGDWLPAGCFFPYRDSEQAAELIGTLADDAIAESARIRSAYVQENFMPKKLFGEMLARAKVAA